jgi:hypothetical protein
MFTQQPRAFAGSLLLVPFLLAAAPVGAQRLTNVPTANPRIAGVTLPTKLSVELAQIVAAQGSMPVENPLDSVNFYGYLGDQPNLVPALGSNVEASKTEPDKNTYLVLRGQKGADAGYDYGQHFLFQGHEGPGSGPSAQQGSITRINLDADAALRVTVLATRDRDNVRLPTSDGSTWNPFARRLLFTAEGNGTTTGGVWQATVEFPSIVENLLGVLGRGGFEGIQNDSAGNLWVVEDIGGATVGGARLPNSFIFRFVPNNPRDLRQGGKMQALQVMSLANPGQPIVFQSASALTQDLKDLHSYGKEFDTRWVTIHDNNVDGFAVFNANQLAKDKGATPFKRPENGVFRPGTHFREFFFTETGDTNATSTGVPDHGGFGGIMQLTQSSPVANTGKLTMFFKSDLEHGAFDNIAFWSEHRLVVVEDRGETLHTQGNALDSAWMSDTRKDYADPTNVPIRIIAQGRDVSATMDAGLLGGAGFFNDGDNELTGIHVSDGDPDHDGILGAKIPRPFKNGWRVFYTQQHGDNVTYEIFRAPRDDDDRRDEKDD